jgi:hypothetical protein
MRPPLSKYHRYAIASTPDLIARARVLHGAKYKEVGYVDELNEAGMVEDPYVDFSTYFAAINEMTTGARQGSVDGTIREIRANPHGFPTLTDFDLYPGWAQLMLDATAENTVELSALAADTSSFREMIAIGPGLYRFVWQRNQRKPAQQRQRYWLGAIDANLFEVFVGLFHFCFVQIGEAKVYKGSLTVPAVLDLAAVPQYMFEHDSELFEFFIDGLEPEFAPFVRGPIDADTIPIQIASAA